MSDCCKFLYKKQNKKKVVTCHSNRTGTHYTPRGHTHTGKYQNSHHPGSARPNPQPPTPHGKQPPSKPGSSERPSLPSNTTLGWQGRGWGAPPPPGTLDSSLTPAQPADLAMLRASVGARTEARSSHQPTVTLAQAPSQAFSSPIQRPQDQKGRGRSESRGRGSQESMATGPLDQQTEAASPNAHSSELGPSSLPHMPQTQVDPRARTGPSPTGTALGPGRWYPQSCACEPGTNRAPPAPQAGSTAGDGAEPCPRGAPPQRDRQRPGEGP